MNRRRAFDQWPVASAVRRLAAQVIDQSLVAIAAGLVLPSLVSAEDFNRRLLSWFLLWLFASIATQSMCLWMAGQTLGKWLMGIQIKSAVPDSKLTPWQILVRASAWWLGALSLGATWAGILSRRDRRAWHDLVAETVVFNIRSEASERHGLEQRIGQAWVFTVCLVVLSVLASSLVSQIKKMKKSPAELQTKSSVAPEMTPDEMAWLLVAGVTVDQVKVSTDVPTDRLLFSLLKSFAVGMATDDKRNFYKNQMKADEDTLCSDNSSTLKACQSAQLLASLMEESTMNPHTPLALTGLQVQWHLNQLPNVDEKVQYLVQKSLEEPLLSTGYLAAKLTQARLQLKAGQFRAAAKALSPDSLALKNADNLDTAQSVLASQVYDLSCFTESLSDCKHLSSFCQGKDFFEGWSKGCNTKKMPGEFHNAAEALGFWWNEANTRKTIKFSQWEKTVKKIQPQTKLESQVFAALDFALAVKSREPYDLVERSNAVGPENPLWAWAQGFALKRYGAQWSYLIKLPEKKLVAQMRLMNEKTLPPKRAVASTEKKKKKRKKKKNKKN